MAKVLVKYRGESSFLDLIAQDYELAENTKSKLVFEMTEQNSEVARIIASGDGFVTDGGLLAGGQITRVQLQNSSGGVPPVSPDIRLV